MSRDTAAFICMTEFMDMDNYDPQDMQLTESEKEAIENIKNAQTREEIVNIISKELVRCIMEQLEL